MARRLRKDKSAADAQRDRFFQKQVHTDVWKNSMRGEIYREDFNDFDAQTYEFR